MSAEGKSGKPIVIVLVLSFVLVGVAMVMIMSKAGAPKAKVAKAAAPVKTGMTDEERKAYIASFIELENVEIGVITHTDHEGKTVTTAGLVQVTGTVHNKGDKPIKDLVLMVKPQDDQDKVLGSFQDTISGQSELLPGASREFKFQIPDKKEFSGHFLQTLK